MKFFYRLVKFQSLVRLQTETDRAAAVCLTLAAADSQAEDHSLVAVALVVQAEVVEALAVAVCLHSVAAECLSNGALNGRYRC